ncbi:hypothetical protein F5B19DRAFT_480130 [Rostrohypoxylon terebratum]|nr:hypothetical protein F5B19DRAFT_480130 [Rostrohypoxylon terebratum]
MRFQQRHAPNMAKSTQHSTAVAELGKQVPISSQQVTKQTPTVTVKPTMIQHIQRSVRWALKHRMAIAIGGYSDDNQYDNLIAFDMSAFGQVHVITEITEGVKSEHGPDSCVVAEIGCKTERIINRITEEGFWLHLETYPSVGNGSWLANGGDSYLNKLHWPARKRIIGAVIVGIDSGDILCIGCVPSEHWPPGGVRPEDEAELLQALQKGAKINIETGIVVSLIFKINRPNFALLPSVLKRGNLVRRRLSDTYAGRSSIGAIP